MDEISDRLKNYILFKNISDFVGFLANNYPDKPLHAYKNYISSVDLLNETEDFVKTFKDCLKGKHRAKYCEGIYINIPKFLSYQDENFEKIKDGLYNLSKLYEDFSLNDEFLFIKKHCNALTKNFNERSDSVVMEANSLEDMKNENTIKNLMESFTPDLKKIQEELYEKNLDIEMIMKIFTIFIYDKIVNNNLFEEDIDHIKNILTTIVNMKIREDFAEKKMYILKEFLMIKNKNNLMQYKNLLNNLGGVF